MNKSELLRKYTLVKSGNYADIRAEALNFVVNISKSDLSPDKIQGMLLLLRGDGKGHTNWIDGSMVAIVPPEYQFYLGKLDDFKYVESGHKKMAKGYVGHLSGWDIVESNNIYQDSNGYFYPLFGIRGKTLAGGVSSNLNTKAYNPEKNYNTAYKGYGLFGVGSPRADFLGTVKINAPLQLSQRT